MLAAIDRNEQWFLKGYISCWITTDQEVHDALNAQAQWIADVVEGNFVTNGK